MRFRTKLLLTWGGVVVLLWLGTLAAVRQTIEAHSDRLADLNFQGTRKSLHSLQAERVERMRQAGTLVMSIPELRALIAEHNFEVSAENVNSLQERLDSLNGMLRVSFICVLDARGALIAQNHGSPWKDLRELGGYLSQSPQATALVKQLFSRAPGPDKAEGRYALWEYRGRLYEVMGQALVFNSPGTDGLAADGALIMAAPLTDDLALELGESHDCQVSFLAEGQLAACSLPAAARAALAAKLANAGWPVGQPFDIPLAGVNYRSFLEDLNDPCSGTLVGHMLIQSSRADAEAERRRVTRNLIIIMATGLGLAAWISLPLSSAVTRPVQVLVRSVRRVAAGDLKVVLPADRRDELGELARAFNDMVVQLRTRQELQRLVESSQAASTAKSQFLANMSHEIRTPLNGVVGMIDLLRNTSMTDIQHRYVELAREAANSLLNVINDILDFSKIEAGKVDVENIEFELHKLVEDLSELLGPVAAKKNIALATFLRPDVPRHLMGDPNRVRQVLMNLINNALKFTSAGSVTIRCTVERRENDRMIVRVAVQDTGIGIPRDRIDRLFKNFSQADSSTTRKFGGTGLGLAICKRLAGLMGGEVGIDSEEGKGSTFWFTVNLGVACPVLSLSKGGPDQTDVDGKGAAIRGLLVLAVDSNPIYQRILEEQLDGFVAPGSRVVNAQEALASLHTAAAQGQPFGAALLPYGSSDLAALSNIIASDPLLRPTRFIAIMDFGDSTDLDSVRRAGFQFQLHRPFVQSRLLDAIAMAIAAPGNKELAAPPESAAVDSALAGLHLLVAEDNDINQFVTQETLRSAGCTCDIVGDGESAVKASAEKHYDAVLMDCQMPGMDGLEASRHIRTREGDNPTRRLPIIALTAEAIQGDREHCLAAGMDGYVTKPIDADALFAAIAALVFPKQSTNESPLAPPAPPIDVEALLNRCLKDADFACRTLEKFQKRAASNAESLRRGVANSDAAQIRRVANNLKAASAHVAADSLRDVAFKIEQLSSAADFQDIAGQLDQLTLELERCTAFIPSAMQQLASAAGEKPMPGRD
jgi:signal transduction histidine kinase/DNA-binding response OmpR family regulator